MAALSLTLPCYLFPISHSNKSETLPLATRCNVACVGLSPDGNLAILVDEGICFVFNCVEEDYVIMK